MNQKNKRDTHKGKQDSRTTNKPEVDSDMPIFKKTEIIIQAFIAIFTFGALVVFSFQLRTMREQTEILKTQTLNQSRAWVTIKEASYTNVEKGKNASAKIVFVNSGNTPALKLAIHNNIIFSDKALPDNAPLIEHDGPRSISVMGPQTTQNSYITQKAILTDKNIEDFKAGKYRLYVWGKVKYTDILGNERGTDFCLVSKANYTVFDTCENNNDAY